MAKNQYLVTLKVADRNALADIIDAVEGKATSVEIATIVNEHPVKLEPKPQPAVRAFIARKPRKLRGSKVNHAILDAMSGGSATVNMLKIALEHAGMSPGSLSSGIAALTKSGQIERVSEGTYSLKTAKAAE